MNDLITCENCGAQIGKLETPKVWNDRAVCGVCHTRLTAASAPIAVPYEPQRQVAASSDDATLRALAELRLHEESRASFSGVRVIGMLLLIAGIPLMCIIFPIGLGMMILGAVLVVGGR